MAALDSKFHVKIGGFGFLLAKQARTERHIYTREEAPTFVNKFASGDPNFRDSTFFPHWAQLGWQNGFDQEFFDDGGKFFRSSAVDPTSLGKLTLAKRFFAAGQTTSGVKITAQEAWRSAEISAFGNGQDGALTISVDTTDTPIDASCSGTQGSTTLSATNASFTAGQQILVIQMQGTNAGNYLKTKIQSYSSGTITTEDALNVTYDSSGSNKAQVLVMKQYTNVTIDSAKTLTGKTWTGSVGGVLAFLVSGTLTTNGNISVNGNVGSWNDDAADGLNSSTTTAGVGFLGGRAGDSNTSNFTSEAGESSTGTRTQSASANGMGGAGVNKGSGTGSGGGGGGGHATSGTAGQVTGTGSGGGAGGTGGSADLSTLLMGGAGGGGCTVFQNGSGGGGSGGGIILIYANTVASISGSITATGGNGGGTSGQAAAGGGGAGGSVLLMCATATLGTNKITALGGTGGGSASGTAGGDGGNGRISIHHSGSITGTTNPTLNDTSDSNLVTTPGGSSFTHMVGTSEGKVYSWDGASTYTELFDTRRLEWFETGTDLDRIIGDQAGTERAQSMSFQVDASVKSKAVSVNLKKNAGTPGDITVRIETNNAGVPSGTLVDDNATATITSFSTSTYAWKTVEFPGAFSLSGATTYWIVLKTAAAANDNNYAWASKSTSGYSAGNMANSADGGSTWAAAAGEDAYFRLLGNSTWINTLLVSDITGTTKMYVGVGDPDGTTAGDARIYDYDGTNWTLTKIFTGTNEATIGAMIEFGATTRTIYIGLGSKAKVYTTTNFSSFTLAKTITNPRNPGYVLSMAEYNGKLFVGGGFPENLPGNNNQYGGFLYTYDEFSWVNLFPFDHTVITSLQTYDTLLFIGTIKRRLYVFNTASIDKLFEFPWDVKITSMVKWDDKLAVAIAPTPGSSASTHEGIYLFDRNGFHNAFNVTSRSWYSLLVFNNNLMGGNDDGYVYQTSFITYQASGTLQTSYDEASLPNMDKIRRSVTLMYESLPTGCTIQVEYKTDESDSSWTSLGTASTVSSTEATFTFTATVYSRKISYRITLATSVSASTPTLKKIIHKYVIAPDFKYRWNMKLLCADNMIWQDNTEPAGLLNANVSAGATSITLKSIDNSTPTGGFPDPAGSTMYASIINPSTGVADRFTYTGKTGTTLTGIPSAGANAIGSHSVNDPVKILAGDFHQKLLDLKQTKQLYTFTDIDGLTYTVLFHSFQVDTWSINQDDYYGGLENEVPVTLLEA